LVFSDQVMIHDLLTFRCRSGKEGVWNIDLAGIGLDQLKAKIAYKITFF
jgi:hypothetical protein